MSLSHWGPQESTRPPAAGVAGHTGAGARLRSYPGKPWSVEEPAGAGQGDPAEELGDLPCLLCTWHHLGILAQWGTRYPNWGACVVPQGPNPVPLPAMGDSTHPQHLDPFLSLSDQGSIPKSLPRTLALEMLREAPRAPCCQEAARHPLPPKSPAGRSLGWLSPGGWLRRPEASQVGPGCLLHWAFLTVGQAVIFTPGTGDTVVQGP